MFSRSISWFKGVRLRCVGHLNNTNVASCGVNYFLSNILMGLVDIDIGQDEIEKRETKGHSLVYRAVGLLAL